MQELVRPCACSLLDARSGTCRKTRQEPIGIKLSFGDAILGAKISQLFCLSSLIVVGNLRLHETAERILRSYMICL